MDWICRDRVVDATRYFFGDRQQPVFYSPQHQPYSLPAIAEKASVRTGFNTETYSLFPIPYSLAHSAIYDRLNPDKSGLTV
ncbi:MULTISPECIES: hypothetical protein [unclassified Roseofilum]|uniref:hypothetical protein n=1 Tax=unclassified Roseofilum TaxID=2620099 RepID=UPI001B27EF93|nr:MULTISPECIES: hypothetical protein [unclassified Roseofilum]MBP0011098.1 hypothetical protein [Roseofilum sp. Belize Diploria]MBP0035557.1 hypothetical protein [Roseofilum sp. Belize BBD 4]MBP0041072.1 hypothetical protein [Roseofilum sp. SBFL]